jgi:hypothetical protein
MTQETPAGVSGFTVRCNRPGYPVRQFGSSREARNGRYSQSAFPRHWRRDRRRYAPAGPDLLRGRSSILAFAYDLRL